MSDDAHLDGCEVDFTIEPTPDDDIDGFVMFADVRDDPDAVEARRAQLVEWGAALRGK